MTNSENLSKKIKIQDFSFLGRGGGGVRNMGYLKQRSLLIYSTKTVIFDIGVNEILF